LHLAISELAKGVRDFKTSRKIATVALKGAETSMRQLVVKNSCQPKELDKAAGARAGRTLERPKTVKEKTKL
jgi:hypothetical protein